MPDKGADSPTLGVPLPAGAVALPSPPGSEAYRAGKNDTVRGIFAFYGERLGGKPYRGYEWCGGTSNSQFTKAALVWHKKGTSDVLRIALDGSDPAGVVITIVAEASDQAGRCPPGAIDPQPEVGDNPGL